MECHFSTVNNLSLVFLISLAQLYKFPRLQLFLYKLLRHFQISSGGYEIRLMYVDIAYLTVATPKSMLKTKKINITVAIPNYHFLRL